MKPINLYFATRPNKWEIMRSLEEHLSNRQERMGMREHEWQGIRKLVKKLEESTKPFSLEIFDSFYCGYRIPHIGKEFDLLRIGEDRIVNVELKSQIQSPKQALDQLRKNRYYLENLSREMDLYSYISEEDIIYRLTNDNIEEVNFSVLAGSLKNQGPLEKQALDRLFSPSNFLISPITTPERFLNREYFLTSHQQFIKKEIHDFDRTGQNPTVIGIKGMPGTGKSLLLYDIALGFARDFQTVIFHCGPLPEGLQRLNYALERSPALLEIASLSQLKDRLAEGDYRYLFIDESHRMTLEEYGLVMDYGKKNNCHIFFSYDPKQIMTVREQRDNISALIEGESGAKIFVLTSNIRFNTEIYSFIHNLMDLSKRHKYNIYSFPNVDIIYARDKGEVFQFLDYFRRRDYVYINYVTSQEESDPFRDFRADYDSYSVIGQEFERVVMVMNSLFYYDYMELKAKNSINSDYLYIQMLYQGVTRARSKLALIIWNDPDLLQQLLMIVNDGWMTEESDQD